jgi:hypothetical protein
MINRRQFLLQTICVTALASFLAESRAFAGERPAAFDAWARSLAELNNALVAGEIDAETWQWKIEALNTSLPIADLKRYLDIDALVARFKYATNLAETADPHLPPEVLAAAGAPHQWFIRVFGLRRGGAVVPHVHNRMASAHLVIDGSFRVRTADRVADLADAVVLKPTRDVTYGPGHILSMSEARDNMHWLLAREDHSMTFDTGVVDIAAMRAFKLPANEYNMIYVDAGRPPERDGTVVAPTMTFEACAKKYADWTA